MRGIGGLAVRVALLLGVGCICFGEWRCSLPALTSAEAAVDTGLDESNEDVRMLPATVERQQPAADSDIALPPPREWLTVPSPKPDEGAALEGTQDAAFGLTHANRKTDAKKTDLLARRRRTQALSGHAEAAPSYSSSMEADALPPYRGTEEMFMGGLLLIIAGGMGMQNLRDTAGLFLGLVFALVGLLYSLFGVVYQVSSHRKRKRWIKAQGSLLDHLHD